MSTSRTREKADGELFKSTGIDDNATSTAITIDASENVGIGTVSPTSPLHITGSGHTALTITGGASSDAQIRFGDSANTTIGMINYDNAINALKFVVNGSTAAIIDNGGRAIIGGGVTLGNGSTYAAANTLDDYEEGTFSPTIQNGITSPVYGQQNGSYIKIGSSVWFSIDLQATSGTANSSAIQFGGLPFASSSSSVKGFGEASWSYGNMINSHSLTAGEFGMHISWGGQTLVALYYGVSQILGTSSGVNMNGRAIISGSYRTDA